MITKKNIGYGLLLCLLLVMSVITSLAVISTNQPYLKMHLSSEVNVDEQVSLPLDLIKVDLKKWNSKEQFLPSIYQETFNLTSDSQDFGSFEGMSYDRYMDLSLLWVKLEWRVSYNDSCVTAYIVLIAVDSMEGTKTLELSGCDWTLEWLWQNDYSDLRSQDDYLYITQMVGMILIAGIMTVFATSYLANWIERSK